MSQEGLPFWGAVPSASRAAAPSRRRSRSARAPRGGAPGAAPGDSRGVASRPRRRCAPRAARPTRRPSCGGGPAAAPARLRCTAARTPPTHLPALDFPTRRCAPACGGLGPLPAAAARLAACTAPQLAAVSARAPGAPRAPPLLSALPGSTQAASALCAAWLLLRHALGRSHLSSRPRAAHLRARRARLGLCARARGFPPSVARALRLRWR